MFNQRLLRVASQALRRQASQLPKTINYTSVRTLVPANPPDLMKEHKKPVWHREGVDEEPLPIPDLDERRTDSERDYDELDNAEINQILDEEYVEPEIAGKFRAYMKIVNAAEPVRFFNKDILLHPTLKKATYAFFEEAESTEHYNAIIDAAWRCHEIDFFEDILTKVASRGHVITHENLLCMLQIAIYRRSPEIFEKFLARVGDKSTWSKEVYLNVVGYYEMMKEYANADALYAEAVDKKVIFAPWRPIFRSHYYARREAQTVPTRYPMWDEQSPMSDVVQINALPILQARVALRYAIYSMQGRIQTEAHKPIRVPHNLVVQCVRRKARGQGVNEHKAWQWAPMKHQLMDYLRKYGCRTGQIADAGNLFYVDKKTFDKLPTPETLL